MIPIGGIVVNIRDITERKSLEQRVRDVDRSQTTIIESLADGVMMVDAAGTVIRVNEAFEVMFEAPRVRLVGRRLDDLLAAGAANGVELIVDDGATGRPLHHPSWPPCAWPTVGRCGPRPAAEGRPPMWVRVNAQAMIGADGTVTGAVASFSDVTALRQSAAELQREERFLQVLLDTLEEGIVACDAEGRITVFNPAARALHGLDEGTSPSAASPATRACGDPTARPWPSGRTR